MNVKLTCTVAVMLAVTALSGCGSIGSRMGKFFSTDPQEEQYQKAAVLPPLEVPPDLTLNADNSALRIPGVDDGTAVAAASAAGLGAPQEASAATKSGALLRRAEDGTLRIEIKQDFARAWREVGLALDAAEIKIEDRDRSRGIFFVRYPVARERQRGFTSMLTFWRKTTEVAQTRFLVLVQAQNDSSNVLLFDDKERLATTVVANEILNKIHQHLE